MINLYQLIYISKYCHFYIWLLHFLLSRVSTENRSVCHGNRVAIVLHSSHEHVAIETRERGCIANKRSGRGLSMIEVKVVDRRDSAWHGTMCQSYNDLRSKRFALSSDLQLLIELFYQRCNIFAKKCAERCDVWRACDTFESERAPTGLDDLTERCDVESILFEFLLISQIIFF